MQSMNSLVRSQNLAENNSSRSEVINMTWETGAHHLYLILQFRKQLSCHLENGSLGFPILSLTHYLGFLYNDDALNFMKSIKTECNHSFSSAFLSL